MLVLITYDVATESAGGKKRLRQIADECRNYGQRVQYSVFECDVDYSQYLVLKRSLLSLMNVSEDSIRFYKLGNNYKTRIECYGAKKSYDPEGLLLI